MSEEHSVLVVDDDAGVGKVLVALLRQDGIAASHALRGADALHVLATKPVDVVITDLRMPGMDGMAVLAEVKRRWPEVPVIVLTAHGSVALAVEAMRAGAADFMCKPFDRDEVLHTVRKALVSSRRAIHEPPNERIPGKLIGDSAAMRELTALIAQVAPTTATVLLLGETGTGKELAARAVHDASKRAGGPFVVLNCAALPESLLESELFGHEKGAFTGAVSRKPGRVELAEKGTLFLDEIGEVALGIQAKLLRLLQEREYVRVGGTRTLAADVRFVAATHRSLEGMVAAGTFRQDLFYRLHVLPVRIAPLRERAADIAVLATHFCARLGVQNERPEMRLGRAALELLGKQPWPGNVRELQNFVERLVILSHGPEITGGDVDREFARSVGLPVQPAPTDGHVDAPTLEDSRRQAERETVRNALERASGNRSLAARLLGVSRRTLYNKLAEHGLATLGPASTT